MTLEPQAWLLWQARGGRSKLMAASSSTGLSRAPATRAVLISFDMILCSHCLLLKPSNWGVYSRYFSVLLSPSQRSCSNSTALTRALRAPGSLNATCLCHLPLHNYPFQAVTLLGLWAWLLPPFLQCPSDTEVGTLRLSPKAVHSHRRMRTGLGNRDDPHPCAFGAI